jgi:hypothetical protein
MVVDKRIEVLRKDVAVVHLPCGNDRVELRPAFNGFFEGLNFGDVGHLLMCVDCKNGALGETLNGCCVQSGLGFVELFEFLFFLFHDRRL